VARHTLACLFVGCPKPGARRRGCREGRLPSTTTSVMRAHA
jgi:hypothetical protein